MQERNDCSHTEVRDGQILTRVFYGQNRMGDILVVEDCSDTAEAMRLCLELEGFRVCVAENRDDALLNIKMATFQCIIMDVYMCGLDLETFLELIRKKSCPLILTSAGYDIEEVARKHGITRWLKKTDIPDNLLDMIDELV
jgi:DNA-binding NtrC family response regulator